MFMILGGLGSLNTSDWRIHKTSRSSCTFLRAVQDSEVYRVHPNLFGKLIHKCGSFEEITGKIGDVFLIHPYTLHAASGNPSGRARFITNPAVSLNEPMCFDRPDGDYSLVEQSVLNALDVPSLDWEITSERERVVPERVARQKTMLEEQTARLGLA